MRFQDKCAACLSAATRMLNLLIRFWQNLNDTEFSVLEHALSPNVYDNGKHVSVINKWPLTVCECNLCEDYIVVVCSSFPCVSVTVVAEFTKLIIERSTKNWFMFN